MYSAFINFELRMWVLLATACLIIGLLSMSCGGAGTAELVPDSTPNFSLSSSTLDFTNQSVGTASQALTATLTNGGNGSLTLSAIQVTGSDAGDFSLTNTCGASLAPSAQCALSVKFTPSAAGSRKAAVVFTDNASSSPQTLSLAGTGTAPEAALSATTLAFGNQSVGTSSPAQMLSLTNNGNGALGIASVVVTGADSSDFPETTDCGSSLGAGGKCTVSVTFTPTASGSRTAFVGITDTASGSPHTVALSGMGVAPAVSLSPPSLSFVSQTIGTSSTVQTITLTNGGSTTLSITSLVMAGANAGDFAQTNSCGSSVASGGSCTISVTFTPSASGSRTASVSVTDNASGSPQTVGLSGAGVAPAVSLSPTSLSFVSQTIGTSSTVQTITLTDSGSATLSISSLVMAGANAGDFAQTNTCGSSVASGGSCTIGVTFTPSASGSRTASLSVTDNASSSPQTVSLSGTGVAPAVSLSPTSLSFVSQTIGTSQHGSDDHAD